MRKRNYKKNQVEIWGQKIKIAQIIILTFNAKMFIQTQFEIQLLT